MQNAIHHTQQTVPLARRLRQATTKTEEILWKKLRAKRFCGYKFRRQVPVGPYIADFACIEQKTIVEIDGDIHELKKGHDHKRDAFLRSQGFRILRLSNRAIRENMEGSLERLLVEFLSTPHPNPCLPAGRLSPHLRQGSGGQARGEGNMPTLSYS